MSRVSPAMLGRTARLLAAAMAEAGASAEIAKMLIAAGRLTGSDPMYAKRVTTATRRFTQTVEQLVESALQDAVDTDEGFLKDLLRWFVRPEESYTIEEIAALLRITIDDAADVYHDEIGQGPRPDDVRLARVKWADVLVVAAEYGLLRPYDVERALGADIVEARSVEAWRTVPVLIRIPRYVAEAIGRETVVPHGLPLPQRIERILYEQFRIARKTRGGGDPRLQ